MSEDMLGTAVHKLWERVSDTAIRVFSQHPVKLPFSGAKPEPLTDSDLPESWLVELRDDDELYVDDRRVELFLTQAQRAGAVRGYNLDNQLKSELVLHPNIFDALYENTHLIPESWKVDSEGRTRYIFFWAVRFRGSDHFLRVRYQYWNNGQWRRGCDWLGALSCNVQRPVARLAS